MTPQELKKSILQIAVQGKIVEQRAEEGTAEEPYKIIQATKQELINEGMIKKEKLLPQISEDEIPFDIPVSWKWVRLGELVKISTGKKDANYGTADGRYEFYTCSKDPILSPTYSFDGECIILPGNGANVGLSIYHVGKFEAYQRTYVLEKYCEGLDFKYLNYSLNWNWEKYNADKMFGSAIPFIKLGNLQSYILPLPPLEEQKRIVAKIEELLPYIDKYEKAWTKLEEFNKKFPDDMQKSILQMAIQGKLVEQLPEEGTAEELYKQIQAEKQKLIKEGKIKKDKPLPEISEDEIPFDIPNSWKWCYLGEIFDHISGKALNAKNTNGSLHKYITTSNVYWDHFELDKLKEMYYTDDEVEKYSLRQNDLLVLEGGDVGRTAIWDRFESYCIQNHIHRLRAYVNVSIKYFYYVMMLLKNIGTITGKGIGIKGLSAGALHRIVVPVPPLEEQKRIVAKIEELLPLCNKLK